ncbi:hypothetical protein [Streptomyces sp. NBC_01422]|uniref:hypothetical protein n=1 Tax=Streptomyces sp. NBC_01422 TaxID=2903859 RepID=UPI002E2CE757|nr:hypothetical protein [Streptomyces sp. NBC_01422]
MNTSNTTPTPAQATTDQALTEVCQSSGEHLAGLLAHGMLEAVSRPGKLPELLFPDGDPALVRAVWEAALAVGYQAGKLSARPTWTPDALRRLRAELDTAGYVAMGRLAGRAAAIHPPRHPADDEAPTQALVRDGGHP